MNPILKIVLLILLLNLAASAQPIPYAPYRTETTELHDFVEREREQNLYIVQSTPVPESAVPAQRTLHLAVTLSREVELDSVPPLSEDWELTTPAGVITKANLAQYGEVTYSRLPRTEAGVSYPPNTLVFALPNLELEQDTLHQFALALHPRRAERLPAEPPDPPLATSWSLRVDSLKPAALEGRVALNLEPVEEGEVVLDPLLAPILLRGEWTEHRLSLDITARPLPDTLPYLERHLRLEVLLALSEASSGQSVSLSQAEALTYQEVRFPYAVPEETRKPESVRRWQCRSGELTLTQLEDEHAVFSLSAVMEPVDENASGVFALSGQVRLRRPDTSGR